MNKLSLIQRIFGIHKRAKKVVADSDRGDAASAGALIILTEGTAIAPFIYTLF